MANNREIGVNLSFTADTQKAKTQLQELQDSLAKITKSAGDNRPLGITSDLTQAINKTTQLQAALQKATTSTGKLDLSQFKYELDKVNLSADELATTLSQFGVAGQQAFMNLAKSIGAAEMPIKRTNRLVQEFATTMKNTAKWMLSSGILHSFMSSVQRAVGYVEDLNTSLNHIRIVTGQSTDQMAKFAKEANAAAKSLSATTTAYTDASLIFYQQGLTGDDVKERTDAVIKLSNITGESVEDVSSYMTAIWNNFADGSTSLEHFVDVITALGATTASSSAEIAEGLEKFAAIGQTVGLSYDYATAALATVVAKTRLSADTVGNAFKTIFARLQSLKLGETLEDNVDLTKYTAALDAVGVQVLDVSGNLRDLDGVLDDLADKWNLMTEAERAALAQTVAGTRQYSQFIALMDNWSDVQNNLLTAKGAEGTLQAQADIYAESWEAARKRVQAAAQGVYQSILDDDFFIKLNNGFASILESLENVIKSFGGLKGLLPGIGALLLNVFGNELNNSIQNAIYNIQKFTKSGQEALTQKKIEFNNALMNFGDDSTPSGATMLEVYKKQGIIQNEIIAKNKEIIDQGLKLSDVEQTQINLLTDIVEKKGEEYIQSMQLLETAQQEAELARENARDAIQVAQDNRSSTGSVKKGARLGNFEQDLDELGQLQAAFESLIELRRSYAETGNEKAAGEGIQNILKQLDEIAPRTKATEKQIGKLKTTLKELAEEALNGGDTVKAFNNVLSASKDVTNISIQKLSKLTSKFNENTAEGKEAINAIEALIAAYRELGDAEIEAAKKGNSYHEVQKKQAGMIPEIKGEYAGAIDQIMNYASALSSVGMAINSIKSLTNIWSNEDLSAGEKLVSTFTTLGFLIPSVTNAFKQFSTVHSINVAIQKKAIKAKQMEVKTTKDQIIVETLENLTSEKSSAIKLKEALAVIFHKKEVQSETVAMVARNVVAKASMGIFTALALIITGVVAIVQTHKKAIKEDAEQTKENAKVHKELTDSYEEEGNKISDLTSKYEDLYKQWKDTGLEEYKNQIIDLMREHENQEGVVFALTGQYEKLNEVLKEQQKTLNETTLASAKLDEENYRKAFKSNIKSVVMDNGGDIDNYGDTIDLKGFNVFDKAGEKEFKEALENILGPNAFIGAWDHLSIDALAEGLMKDADAIKKVLNNFSNVEAANELKKYINNLDELISGYGETISRINNLSLERIFNQKGSDSLFKNFSADKYINLIEGVQQEAKKQNLQLTEQEVNEWVRKQILGIEEVAHYAKSAEIAQLILNKVIVFDENDTEAYIDEVLNTFSKAITDFSDEEQAYFATNPFHAKLLIEEYIAGTKTQEDISKDIGKQTEYNKHKIKADSALGILSNIVNAKKNKLTDEDRITAYNLLGIEPGTLKDSEILTEIREFYRKEIDLTNNYFEEASEAATKHTQDMFDQYSEEQAILDSMSETSFKDFATSQYYDNHMSDMDAEELQQNLITINDILSSNAFGEDAGQAIDHYFELIEQGIEPSEELAQAMSELAVYFTKDGRISSLKGITKEWKESNTEINEQTKKVNECKEAWDEARQEEKRIQEQTEDLKTQLESLSVEIDSINKNIDNLQSAYKTISTAEQEYAETGSYSIDTIQSLLDLSPEEMKYMSIKGDAIQTEIDLIKKKQLAEYDALEAKYREQAALEIDIVLNQELRAEEYAALQQKYNLIAAEGALNGTLEESIATLRHLTSEGYSAAGAMADYYQSVKDVIDLGRKNIDTGFQPSGKSAKASQKEYKEYLEELPDRYYDINNAIKEVTHSLEVLQKFQDKLAGKALINSLIKQNKLIEKQQENYKKLAGMLKSEQQQLQGQNKLGQFGAQFDTNGRVTNYAETYSKIEAKMISATNAYNAKVAEYNKMTKAEQEANGDKMLKIAEDEYDKAKKLHDDAQDWLSRADEIIDELNDAKDKYIEAQQKKVENNLKKFTERFKIKIDINDAKKQIIGFFREVGEDFTKTFKSSTDMQSEINSYRKEGKLSAKNVKTLGNEFNEVSAILDNENYNYSADDSMFINKAEGIQYAQEVFNQMMEEGKALYESYKSAYEAFLSNISSVNNEWDKITENIHNTIEELDHYQKLTELLYGDTDKGRQLLQQYYETSAQAQLMEQKTLTAKIESYKNLYSQMEVQGAAADSKELEEVRNIINESEKSLRSSIESYLQTIQSEFTNSIKTIIDTMDKSMVSMFDGPSGMGLSQISERWRDAQDAADGYYDEVQRIYQLEQLENKWNKTLKDTKSIKNQQLMKSIMDAQLKNLEEKTELSEYDITLAEKQLEIIKAQMALEDARNNKNTMKLVRNEQGNWAYQYVADEDEIADKEQKALDLLYDKYDFIKKSVAEGTEELLQLQQTAQEKLSAIMEEYMHADETRQAELQEQYDYFYNYYYGENGLIVKKSKESAKKQKDLNVAGMETLWGLYTQNDKNYEKMTDKQIELINKVNETGCTSYLDLAKKVAIDGDSYYNQIANKASLVISETQTQWENLANNLTAKWGTNPDSVRNIIVKAHTDAKDAFDEYKQDIAESESIIKKSWFDIGTEIKGVKNQLDAKSDGLNKHLQDMINKTGDLVIQRQKVDELKKSWEKQKDALEKAGNKLQKYVNLLNQKETYTIHVVFDVQPLDLPNPEPIHVKVVYDDNRNGGEGNIGSDEKWYTHALNNRTGLTETGTFSSESDANAAKKDMENKYVVTKDGKVEYTGTRAQADAYAAQEDEKSQGQTKLKVSKLYQEVSVSKYDTGGYTGNFGAEGKLAMLHEKELVLNKEDTSNILNAVAAVREISGIGSSIANTISAGISNIVSGMLGIKPASAGYPSSTTNNNATNTFHIHAEFPNANSVAEIQEAILNLPNLASQYLSKNKM